METLTRFGVSIPSELLDAFDAHIGRVGYATRSEAIRDMMREALIAGEWEDDATEVVGTVTIVYDHETRELTQVLTELQHQFHDGIICSTHVHLDHHNCLEVIVMRVPSGQVRAAADRLVSTRGVKHGRLVSTTTGHGLR